MLRRLLSKLLGEDEQGADQDHPEQDYPSPYIPGMDEPENKSTVGGREWEWERAGEQPFDHYTAALDRIKELKRERDHEAVEELLLWCLDYLEAEAAMHQAREHSLPPAIAPAYYRHLAIVYRKDNRYADEVSILERYVEACEGVDFPPKDKMLDRLERARELADE